MEPTDSTADPTPAELLEAQRKTREQYAREDHAKTVRRAIAVAQAPKRTVVDPAKAARDAEELRARMLAESEEVAEYDRLRRSADWEAQVPPRFAAAALDTLDEFIAVQVNAWRPSIPSGASLLLTGPTGTGKTFTAYAIAREFFLDRKSVLVRSLAGLLDDIRPGPRSDTAFEKAKSAKLLVLDDWGTERKTDWTDERLHLVIDHRWQWQLPSIVTTNISAEALPDALGDRMFSRLGDNATVIVFSGDDRRQAR